MWNNQGPYFSILKSRSETVFKSLDKSFSPEVFVVGIRKCSLDDQICVEGNAGHWLGVEDLQEVSRIAAQLACEHPDSEVEFRGGNRGEWHADHISKSSTRDAIDLLINQHDNRIEDVRYFVSYPEIANQYLVCIVLGLQTNVIAAYPAIRGESRQVDDYQKVPRATSYVEAVVAEFFIFAARELAESVRGTFIIDSVDSDYLLKRAGDRLLRDCVRRIGGLHLRGMEQLFNACNTIASLQYENLPPQGTLVLAKQDHPAIEKLVTLERPADLFDYRGSRKLLQLANENVALHTDSERIYGLATTVKDDCSSADIYEMQIVGHHHWKLLYSKRTLMEVRYGQPSLPQEGIDVAKLTADLRSEFFSIPDTKVEELVKLAMTASDASHGTMLVITDLAKDEASRLQGQPLTPLLMTDALLQTLTSIDGAVVLSPSCECFSIGVILDGISTGAGDSTRGARYNSALRYVESLKQSGHKCLAIVVSEDGYVTWVQTSEAAL